MERWKTVDDYKNLYEVSSYGRIRSLDRFDRLGRITWGKVLSPTNNGNGYYSVMLCKPNSKRRCYVHRLVATAFVDNPNSFLEINHKDMNPGNNRASNLEWCSRKYNVNYGDHNVKLSHTKGEPFKAINCLTHESSLFYSKDTAASELHIGRDKIVKGLKEGKISYFFKGQKFSWYFERLQPK